MPRQATFHDCITKSDERLPLVEKVRMIKEEAIKSNSVIEIVYLKANDEKSGRIVAPSTAGTLNISARKALTQSKMNIETSA